MSPFSILCFPDPLVEIGVKKREAYAKRAKKINVASKTAERLYQRVRNRAPWVHIGILWGETKTKKRTYIVGKRLYEVRQMERRAVRIGVDLLRRMHGCRITGTKLISVVMTNLQL